MNKKLKIVLSFKAKLVMGFNAMMFLIMLISSLFMGLVAEDSQAALFIGLLLFMLIGISGIITTLELTMMASNANLLFNSIPCDKKIDTISTYILVVISLSFYFIILLPASMFLSLNQGILLYGVSLILTAGFLYLFKRMNIAKFGKLGYVFIWIIIWFGPSLVGKLGSAIMKLDFVRNIFEKFSEFGKMLNFNFLGISRACKKYQKKSKHSITVYTK